MKKIIQLRGTNATGKTTAVRNFIARCDFCIQTIEVNGKRYNYSYDKGRNIIVAGRYDTRECGGVDGEIQEKKVLQEYLYRLLKLLKPEALIIDAVIYGLTFRFGYELMKVGEALGYHYIGIVCAPPLEVALARLYGRNGGKLINEKNLQDKYFACLRAYEKSLEVGMDMRLVDTSTIPREEAHTIIEAVL